MSQGSQPVRSRRESRRGRESSAIRCDIFEEIEADDFDEEAQMLEAQTESQRLQREREREVQSDGNRQLQSTQNQRHGGSFSKGRVGDIEERNQIAEAMRLSEMDGRRQQGGGGRALGEVEEAGELGGAGEPGDADEIHNVLLYREARWRKLRSDMGSFGVDRESGIF